MRSDISSNEPLSEAVFFILLSIQNNPKHGYAIMKEVEQLSDKRIRLSTGTLYGAIKRLLEKHWIEPVITEESQETNSNRPRKLYCLTASGQQIIEEEKARLRSLLAAADRPSNRKHCNDIIRKDFGSYLLFYAWILPAFFPR
ncbi:MAG: PadR family transcriptional regulator [Chloroflexi bacterium]|nr:PadR family transcriptional regulator [Chloroflexota bacterium]